MKKYLPIGLVTVAILTWLIVLSIYPRPTIDLSPYVIGKMQAFEVFPEPLDLPKMGFLNREGNAISYESLPNKYRLINIWATWCEPCKEEMPTLENLQKQIGGSSFEIITISVDWQGFEIVDEFFNQYGIVNLKTFWDNTGLLPAQLEVIGLPLTILVDDQNRWIGRMDGPAEWDSAETWALVRAAMRNEISE